MKNVILVGAGNRGQCYCDYSLYYPEEMKVIAVCDVNELHLKEVADKYGVAENMRFTDLDELLSKKIPCDIVANATMDQMHSETAITIISAGYHMVMENPVTARVEELLDIEKKAKEMKVKVFVCHVLRYTPFYKSIKNDIIREAMRMSQSGEQKRESRTDNDTTSHHGSEKKTAPHHRVNTVRATAVTGLLKNLANTFRDKILGYDAKKLPTIDKRQRREIEEKKNAEIGYTM